MKTFLFVVAFVLGALLTWYLAPRLPPPIGSATEAPQTAPETPAPKAAPEEKAIHMADVRVTSVEDECTLETYPPVLCGRVGDHFVWTIVAGDGCRDYVADLRIEAKAPAGAEELVPVDTKSGPKRRMTVPQYSERCQKGDAPCQIPYKVTVTSADDRAPLYEDPRIEIWP